MSKHRAADYLQLPYTIKLRVDEDGDWVAHIQELEGCTAHGIDQAQALANLREVQEAWINLRLETGKPIPEPEPEEELPSGKWLQRVPRTLHKKLNEIAKTEHTSLNQLVTSMLSEAVAIRPWSEYLKSSPVGTYSIVNFADHPGDSLSDMLWGKDWVVSPHAPQGKLLPGLNTARRFIPAHHESTDAYDPKETIGFSHREIAEITGR